MNLENIFFKCFFFPFLISILLCTIVIIIFLVTFIFDKLDKRLTKKILALERNYSQTIINSANIIITNKFMKFQAALNEQIVFYRKKAKEILKSEEEELNTEFLKCLLTWDDNLCDYNNETLKIAFWYSDGYTVEDNLDEHKEIKQQLIAYSHIIQNLDAIYESSQPGALAYFFYFEKTELYISYPILDGCNSYYIFYMRAPHSEIDKCNNDRGKPYEVYKLKCEKYFRNMMKSKTNIYDINNLSQNKTIFISNFYDSKRFDITVKERAFTMCIEFDDPITEGKGYNCVDSFYTDLINPLEDLNSKVAGFFFVSNVGFSNLLYFPQGDSTPKTSTEQIFNWHVKYYISEKDFFLNNIDTILTTNYIDQIGINIYNEVFVNGKNSSEQIFNINKKEFKYSIYPIIFENLYGKREHVLSLIYVYNNQLYLDMFGNNNNSKIIMIILEIIILIIFGFGLLYLINLTFDTLVKYIVIPAKNVNYMLKGINIGGKNRLKYLEFLKKKQDEILEKLENSSSKETEDNSKENEDINRANNDSINEKNNEDDYNDKSKLLIDEENKQMNDKIKIDKYDEESNYIEKEINFYDFDEELLQYRPLEMDYLIKSLMDLKDSKALTSKDREEKNIINYAYSEKVFRNFQNKEGSIICHSNIGNLQSQLLKYDKAIYHLALSLEDSELKKYLNQNLSDEFDNDDALLNKISNFFNKDKKFVKNNILVVKQMKNSKSNFSQKKIGILINVRYCRLIHAYYKFFKNLKKLKSLGDETMTGQFMSKKFHTINYYHKVLIQFIYLSFVKKDLIKIGESIIDYIGFLIKFKYKTSIEDKYILEIHHNKNHAFLEKQEFKKKIFNKIVGWFNLFDDYISFTKENTSLGDSQNIINDFSHCLNTENLELNLESQTSFMFKVNIQKSSFLKGKFCLYCKNYNDALLYFIEAAKKDCIVIDGLIKKKSLKNIYKLLIKMETKYEELGLKNLYTENEKNKLYNEKFKIGKENLNKTKNEKDDNNLTFGEELKLINKGISKDINEFNANQERDIIILIDFNTYNIKDGSLPAKKNIINLFNEETLIILNNYLSPSDRFGLMVYDDVYKIICPLIYINEIDKDNISKDLDTYKNNILNKYNERENSEIVFNELINNNNEFNDNYGFNENIEFNLDINNDSNKTNENSSEIYNNEKSYYKKINGLVKAINFINDYIEEKDEVKNEKYIIIFTDITNLQNKEDEQIKKIFDNLRVNKSIILILVGKNKKQNIKNENEYNNIEQLILTKFGKKSEIIFFDNMKKIKTTLSNNKVVKEEIFYPNEIYK